MTELALQKFAANLLRLNAVPGVIWFHCPNGEARSARTGAKLRAMGVRRGVADLVIVRPGGLVHFLELKTPKGSLSIEQRAFRDECEYHGIPYAVATSSTRIEAILRDWGALRSITPIPARMPRIAACNLPRETDASQSRKLSRRTRCCGRN